MTELNPLTTVPSVAALGAAYDEAIDDGAQGGATRLGGRPAFLSALRYGHYPVVPEPLATAVAAIEGALDLEREVMTTPAEGLGVFCQRVAADVLAGRGYPSDFGQAAFEAQQSADRVNAQSFAVQAVRRELDQQLPGVITEALPGLLGGLRKRVEKVLAELRKVDEVLGDLDLTDPAAVAAASDEERAAFLRFGELRTTYVQSRHGQRASLQASSTVAPGWHDLLPSGDAGWPAIFEVAVHEVSDPRKHGSLTGSLGSSLRFRSLAHRPDVWVPDVDQLRDAWDRFNEPRPRPVESAGTTTTTTTTTGSAA